MLPPTPWLWREDVSNAGWGFAAARLGSGAMEPAGLTPAQALTIIPENKVGAFSRQASAAGARCRERQLAIMQLILPERKVSILRNKLRASAIYTVSGREIASALVKVWGPCDAPHAKRNEQGQKSERKKTKKTFRNRTPPKKK